MSQITNQEKQQSLFEILNNQSKPAAKNSPQSAPHEVREEAEPETLFEELRDACLGCNRCDLRKGCHQVVFGDGNPRARLMLVGEGPGADEDRLGMPFVGRAGKLLDRILQAADIKREDIYIANIVKCRPPGNRLPLQPEIEACLPYLKKQIELIDPEIILCLGALSMRTLINKGASITRIRGQWYEIGGRKFMATFHPAALLRDPSRKKDVWNDMQEIMKYYHEDNGGSAQ